MRKVRLYKTWLIAGFTIIVLTALATLFFHFTVPKDCTSCNMGAIGLVPFWLLSFLVLLGNCIIIPIHNIRKRTSKGLFLILSWMYCILSFLLLGLVVFSLAMQFMDRSSIDCDSIRQESEELLKRGIATNRTPETIDKCYGN